MIPEFWKKLDTPGKLLALLPLPMLGIVIFDQWFQWSTKEDYTFGYIVPFFAAYVVYDRLPQIEAYFTPAEPAKPDEAPTDRFVEIFIGFVAFVSLMLFVIGGLMRAVGGPNILGTFFNTFGFCGVTAACLWMISEKDSGGRVRGFRSRAGFVALFCFPVLVWIVSGPFVYLVDSQVKYVLLEKVTAAVVAIMNGLDYQVTRTGNVILLPGGDQVGVADACSGIRSLTSCVFFGAFLSSTFITGPVRKLVMLGLAGVFAIFLNVIRTTFLTLWAYNHGSHSLDFDFGGHAPKSAEFTMGTVHDIAGWVAMGVTFLILAALVPLINLRPVFRAPEAPPAPEDLA